MPSAGAPTPYLQLRKVMRQEQRHAAAAHADAHGAAPRAAAGLLRTRPVVQARHADDGRHCMQRQSC
jgi:hypothetical protein